MRNDGSPASRGPASTPAYVMTAASERLGALSPRRIPTPPTHPATPVGVCAPGWRRRRARARPKVHVVPEQTDSLPQVAPPQVAPPRDPKITLIAAGSALAVAGIAAGTMATWPGRPAAASASGRSPASRGLRIAGAARRGMLGSYGWSSSQFSCVQPLWNAESGWNASASNPSSGAYGIPQALPGSKMASGGPDWQTGAATQIRWGLGYIQSVYGSPCAAWPHEQAYGWY